MDEEKPNYYAIIPAEVRYDNDLRAGAKIFYGEITALCSKYGVCTASNNYFAELYDMSPSGVSRWITQLKNKGYIYVEYEKEGKEIKGRNIILNHLNTSNVVVDKVLTNVNRVLTNVQGGIDKSARGYLQKRKENNTSINNTSINNNRVVKKQKNGFIKPSIEEIEEYCKSRHNHIKAEQFYNYYESNGWMVGKNKMKNWKSCVITWEQRNGDKLDNIAKEDYKEVMFNNEEDYDKYFNEIDKKRRG